MRAEILEGSPLDLKLDRILDKVSNVERMTDRLETKIYNIGFAEGKRKAVTEFTDKLKQAVIDSWRDSTPTPIQELIDKIGKEIIGDGI